MVSLWTGGFLQPTRSLPLVTGGGSGVLNTVCPAQGGGGFWQIPEISELNRGFAFHWGWGVGHRPVDQAGRPDSYNVPTGP